MTATAGVLRAPLEDGGLLAAPPLGAAPSALDANRHRLGAWEHDFQGRPASTLRSMARSEVLDRARRFHRRLGLDEIPADRDAPLIVTGHQPELFHPGVWVKNFATSAIASNVGGVGLNLIVDNDTPKAFAARVPLLDGERLKARWVPFDEWGGDVPFEDLAVRDEGAFASFADRALGLMGPLIAEPLLRDDWPRAVGAGDATDRLGLRLAAMRHRREVRWGARNLEVPLGEVCESEAFLWFASHLLAHLDRFRAIYNDELDRYRAAHRIRSSHHPVPGLGTDGDWCEAPFWAWHRERPRRRPLLARRVDPGRMELRIEGDHEPLIELPLGPDREACCAVERLRELPSRGVRLRTRALTTTMFARSILGDLFLHGIGGAKYDELGDAISRRFFGSEPPRFLALSLTLWPGLSDDPATPDHLRAVDRHLRDLTFNPDRHLPDPPHPDAVPAVRAKRDAVDGPTATRRQRIDRYFSIRDANRALLPFVDDARSALLAERDRLRDGLSRNALAHHREFAAVLHGRHRLRESLDRVSAMAGPPGPARG